MYYTLDIIQVIKPRKSKMGVAFSMYGGEERCVQGLVEKPEVKRSLGYQDIFRTIILEWILNESIGREWTTLIRVRTSGTIFRM